MEKIGSYIDEKLLCEHPVIMDRVIISNPSDAPISLERGSVIGLDEDSLKVLFAKDMTDAVGVLAEPVTVPEKSGDTPGEAVAAIYVHAALVLDQLKFAADADAETTAAAVASLKTIGCYAI